MDRELESILAVPDVDEARKYYKNDSLSYEDVVLIQFYKYLISDYIKGLGVFDEAEIHFREEGVNTVKDERKDFFQKTDRSGYDYFYLSSIVRIDRITDDIKSEMTAAMNGFSDPRLIDRAKMFAVSIIPDVLMADKNVNNHSYMLYHDLGKDGFVRDDEVAFCFSSDASFDDKGNYISKESEDERVEYMFRQKEIIEKSFWEKTGYKLQLFIRT